MFSPSKPSAAPAVLVAALLLSFSGLGKADLVYRPDEGWKREGGFFGSSSAVAKTADLQMQYAQDLEKKGALSDARDAYKDLVKSFPLSVQAAEARLKLGGIQEKMGKFENAFETYDELLVKNPESKEFTAALDAMFGIAKRYMNGEKRRLFGVKTFSSNQRAEEMMDTILKRAPYARIAPQVMLFRGIVMERQGKDAEALAAYQQIIERFPTDPIADDAQYQMGYIRLRSVKSGSYDSVDRVRAQESFEDYLNRAPQHGKSTQARENLQILEANRRKAALETALFYEKSGKPKAAAIYFKDILTNHPGSKEAEVAGKHLDGLKSIVGAEMAARPTASPARGGDGSDGRAATPTKGPVTKGQGGVSGAGTVANPAETRAPAGPALRLAPADIAPTAPSGPEAGGLQLQLPTPRLTPPAPQNP